MILELIRQKAIAASARVTLQTLQRNWVMILELTRQKAIAASARVTLQTL